MKINQKIILLIIMLINIISSDVFAEQKIDLTLIRDNLYENKEGDLFIKFSKIVLDQENHSVEKDTYLNHFCHPEDDSSTLIPLREKIDKKTWRQIAASCYADKDHIYLHTPMSSGGFLTIMDDVISSKFMFYHDNRWLPHNEIPHFEWDAKLIQWYANDGKNVYFSGDLVEGADPKTFKVIKSVEGLISGSMGADAISFYDEGKKISRAQFTVIAEKYAASKDTKLREYAKAMDELLK